MPFNTRSKRDGQTLNLAKLNHKSLVTEQFRTVRTNLDFALGADDLKAILVTSAEAGAGKSTVAAGLAVQFAALGRQVLLIDADMRLPSIHEKLGLRNSVGLSGFLSRQYDYAKVVQQHPDVPGLFVITAGPVPPDPSRLVGSQGVGPLFQGLKDYFDVIIVDTPPASDIADARILSAHVDGVVLVARVGSTHKAVLEGTAQALQQVGANILGVVVNGLPRKKQAYSYYYYGSERAGESG